MVLCGAARLCFILSKCKIITLDVFRNIHTFLSSFRKTAEEKGFGNAGHRRLKVGVVDRKLVCNAVLSVSVSPVIGVAGLAGRSGSSCGRSATQDRVFAAARNLGKRAARSGKNHGMKTTGLKWTEKAPA